MNTKEVSLALMAKMALVDGLVHDQEKLMLEKLCAESACKLKPEEIIEIASKHKLADLISKLHSYADQYFVCMHAYMMASIDGELHKSELQLFNELASGFKLEAADLESIKQIAKQMISTEPSPIPARIEELYKQSSFAG